MRIPQERLKNFADLTGAPVDSYKNLAPAGTAAEHLGQPVKIKRVATLASAALQFILIREFFYFFCKHRQTLSNVVKLCQTKKYLLR
ncbi:hypothetical protein ES706_00730 [subsurface metagenome]|nr:hypothetical protein [Hadesarchaea archaeon]